MTEQYRILQGPGGRPDVQVFNDEYLTAKAQFAKLVVIAALEGGESPSKDLAQQACEMTDDLFSVFNTRGWVLKLPTPEEVATEIQMRMEKQAQEHAASVAAMAADLKG